MKDELFAIRSGIERDVKGVLEIYAPYVKSTAVSFESQVPGIHEMWQRMEQAQEKFCWLVCIHEGKVVGYAYTSLHRSRAAYQWSCESSVYTSLEYRKMNMAGALYNALFEIAELQGYHTIFAGMTVPNPASRAFHLSMGFTPVGEYANVGYKFDSWHNTAWYQKTIKDCDEPPQSILPTGEIAKSSMDEILERSANMIKRV